MFFLNIYAGCNDATTASDVFWMRALANNLIGGVTWISGKFLDFAFGFRLRLV